MIFDKLININRYSSKLQMIADVINATNYKLGKIEIDGDNLFAIGLEYQTKVSSEGGWEAHKKYLDLHLIIEGEEIVEITDISQMVPTSNYVEDYQLFNGDCRNQIHLRKGDFLLLFPNEVHKTGVKFGDTT